jgi:nicotinamide mononucleotide adenylyltransferase
VEYEEDIEPIEETLVSDNSDMILEYVNVNEESEEDTSEFFSFKDFKKVVSTNKEKRKIKILNESNDKVNVIIGKFQPFNNGHLKMCSRVKKENNLPIFLCVVHPGGDPNNKFPFSDELVKKAIGSLVSENEKMFAGFEIVPSNLLEDAINTVSKVANPASVCIGEKDFENMLLQREWIRNKYDLNGGDIEIFKTPAWSDNNTVRDYIRNGDFQEFKSKVPKSIAVLFNEFNREMQDFENPKEDI